MPNRRKLILIVDDEPRLAELLRVMVELKFDVRTEVATDGQAAIDRAGRLKPDVILLDVVLPILDGLTACRMLKDNPTTRHIPVVITTASPPSDVETQAWDAGADGFVRKLHLLDDLLPLLEERLG